MAGARIVRAKNVSLLRPALSLGQREAKKKKKKQNCLRFVLVTRARHSICQQLLLAPSRRRRLSDSRARARQSAALCSKLADRPSKSATFARRPEIKCTRQLHKHCNTGSPARPSQAQLMRPVGVGAPAWPFDHLAQLAGWPTCGRGHSGASLGVNRACYLLLESESQRAIRAKAAKRRKRSQRQRQRRRRDDQSKGASWRGLL